MRQCTECEFCVKDEKGRLQFRCNPFVNVKEPECVQKWSLLKMDAMLRLQHATLSFSRKFAPLQEKMFRHIERQLEDMDETDRWMVDDQEDNDDEDQQQ